MKKTRDFLIDSLNYPDITVDDFFDTGKSIQKRKKKSPTKSYKNDSTYSTWVIYLLISTNGPTRETQF